MFLSVVIPTCNRNDLLAKCLDKLKPDVQTIDSSMYEVIITDDGGEAQAKAMVAEKYPWAKWVPGPGKGPAANRNNGAKQATTKWLVFMDDDCLPDVELLSQYAAAEKLYPHVKIFEGCIKVDRPKKHFLEEAPINDTVGGNLWSCNFMIQKDFFIDDLDGFDENFPFAAMEDTDLRERISVTGEEIHFTRNAFVIHPWRLQLNYLEITKKRFASLSYFYNKHPSLRIKHTFWSRFKTELRFFIKDVLLKIIPYKCRGLITYLRGRLIIVKAGLI